MSDANTLDRAHDFVLRYFVESGRGPHYTELAHTLSLPPEAGKSLLHELLGLGMATWLSQESDLIASYSPFSNQPTHYRITVDGEKKWFGQCGFESLAICWLFPGRTVNISAPCLDCGEPLLIDVRDGEILAEEPSAIYGFTRVAFRDWGKNWAFS